MGINPTKANDIYNDHTSITDEKELSANANKIENIPTQVVTFPFIY